MNLVEENLGLVGALVKRFVGKGIEYEELYSAGCEGLCKAANRFDKSRGYAFSTYAVPVILGEIKALFRDGGIVKVSRSIKDLSLKITKASSAYSAKEGRAPTVSELAEILNVTAEQITEAMNSNLPAISLTNGENDEFDIPSEDNCLGAETRIVLGQAIRKLEDTERKLIILRYFGNRTQQETAKMLGISQVQVSRKEKVVLNRLKMELSG